MNQKEKKELLLQTGYAIEIVGNVTLAAAAIFGYLSAFIVLATVANRNSNQSEEHHHHSRSSTNFNYTRINFNFFSNGHCHHYSSHNTCHTQQIDNSSFYTQLLISSILPSLLGIGLAIGYQVTWVAITVAALWASAALLSAAGRGIINYALSLDDEEPSINQDWSLPPSYDEATGDPLFATPINNDEACEYTPAESYEAPWLAQVVGTW